MIRFTAAELAELAAADAEAEAQPLTPDEWKEAAARERKVRRKTGPVAEYQRAYYEANKEKVAERRHQYYLRTGR